MIHILLLFGYILSVMSRCMNEQGVQVDSWFLIKEPKGTRYMYTDSTVPFGVSGIDLNSTTGGALRNTLVQLWASNTTEYIVFNDESLGKKPLSGSGHTKGVWAWSFGSDAGGFVLQHSIPRFPAGPMLVGYYSGLGSNAYTYAQHMACYSLSLGALDTLAHMATLTVADIYDTRVSARSGTWLRALASGVVSKEPVCNYTSVQTVGGMDLVYFAKSSQWNNELYSACIAPKLKTSLVTETWIRGSAEGPFCGVYSVYDSQLLNFTGETWKETQDHSKWAVGLNTSWVCTSDINRMLSQYERGGSGYCFQNRGLADVLQKGVVSRDSCATQEATVL